MLRNFSFAAKAAFSPEELAAAYHRTVGQWHPDKLDNMADDLKAYATKQTQRINEAFHLLRQRL